MTHSEYTTILKDCIAAIYRGDSILTVPSAGPQPDFYFNVPSPQTSGTLTQQASYARQAAEKMLANHGIVEPSIF